MPQAQRGTGSWKGVALLPAGSGYPWVSGTCRGVTRAGDCGPEWRPTRVGGVGCGLCLGWPVSWAVVTISRNCLTLRGAVPPGHQGPRSLSSRRQEIQG